MLKLGLISMIALFSSLCFGEDAKIHLTIHGVRSDKGHVLVSVFDKDTGWPTKPTQAVRVARLKAKAGDLTTGFSGLKPGEYAVAFIHDENDNHKLDKDAEGAPTEGFGFSNNPKLDHSAASFEAAKFALSAPAREIEIKTVYLGQ